MQHTIGLHLWTIGAKGVDIVSRGAVVDVYGDSCNYVGPSPDGSAYFWLYPGECRSLAGDQLKQAGYVLAPKMPERAAFK